FVEPREVERPVHTLRRNDLALARFELPDHLGLSGAGQRVLSPHPQPRIIRLMRVVREHHYPALLTRVREHPPERADNRLRLRIGELPVDEVVEHVHNDQCAHHNLPVIASQSKTSHWKRYLPSGRLRQLSSPSHPTAYAGS